MRKLCFKGIKGLSGLPKILSGVRIQTWVPSFRDSAAFIVPGSLRVIHGLCDLEKAMPMWAAIMMITTWHITLL